MYLKGSIQEKLLFFPMLTGSIQNFLKLFMDPNQSDTTAINFFIFTFFNITNTRIFQDSLY